MGTSQVGAEIVDAMQFRKSIAKFVTGIAIITVVSEDGGVHGMTINSFTSVSLDPPTVLISLKPGKTHSLVVRNGVFGASILTTDQQPYSSHFSGRPQEALEPGFTTRFEIPTLDRCLAWFECEVTESVRIHDHTLFIARVVRCDNADGSPLMFYASRYHGPTVAAA